MKIEIFEHLPDFRVLVCRESQNAVTICRPQKPLRRAPHNDGGHTIERALQWAKKLSIVSGRTEILEIPIPPDRSASIAQLKPV